MVRSQTRPAALEPQPEPEEVVHPAFLNAVLAGWWKKPEPEVVIVEAPPPTAVPEQIPQEVRVETRTIYRAPRWIELTLIAGIGVILCLQVALLVSH